MDEFEALGGAGEDHMVVADRVAAAQGREPDIAGAAGAGDAVGMQFVAKRQVESAQSMASISMSRLASRW